jgi:hypothetical protein
MPVTLSLEQTVEALRKREGGTGLTVWQRSAEGDLWSPGVDRTGRVGGGANASTLQTDRFGDAACRSVEEVLRCAVVEEAEVRRLFRSSTITPPREDLEGQPPGG